MEKAPDLVALEKARERLASGGGQSVTATSIPCQAGQRLREATGGGGGRAVQGTVAGFGQLGSGARAWLPGPPDSPGADEVVVCSWRRPEGGRLQRGNGQALAAGTTTSWCKASSRIPSRSSSDHDVRPLAGGHEIVAGKAVADKAAQVAMTKVIINVLVQYGVGRVCRRRRRKLRTRRVGRESGDCARSAEVLGGSGSASMNRWPWCALHLGRREFRPGREGSGLYRY